MKNRWNSFVFYFLTVSSVLFVCFGGNYAVSVFSENLPIERNHCIIIDPGHGGEDGGATSCTGILESQFNLEISQRLNDLLQLLGYQTRMIRSSDISVYKKGETIAQKKASDLQERVRIANETHNGLLLSIHQNKFSDGKYNGAQVFYSKTDGSQELAKKLQNNFIATINKGSKRQCKKSTGVYLMDHIRCTGILIECGFLSNFEEEAKLQSKEYQQKLCCVIGATVAEYLSNT